MADFTGVFDGNGHTIKNLTIQGNGNQAFFGTVNNAIIKNVTFENPIIISNNGYAAVLAVNSINSTIQNVKVDNAQLFSDKGGGGLFETFKVTSGSNTVANNCNFNGKHTAIAIDSRSIGGFARYISNRDSNATMEISCCDTKLTTPDSIIGSKYSYTGGFAGSIEIDGLNIYTKFTDCSSDVDINRNYSRTVSECPPSEISEYLGGFAGHCYFRSNANGEPIFERCFSTGYLGARGSYHAGGFIGDIGELTG